MPIVDFKSSLMLSDVIATELSELPIVWEMWNYSNKFKGIEYINAENNNINTDKISKFFLKTAYFSIWPN